MDAELCLVAFEDAPMHPAPLLVFWESLGNADSWAPRWTRGARICILTGPPMASVHCHPTPQMGVVQSGKERP